MPEDPKTPLAEAGDSSAQAPATPPSDKSDAGPTETAEQKITRIEKERDDALALSKSLKGGAEEANTLRDRVRDLEAKLQPAGTASDTVPPQIADLVTD